MKKTLVALVVAAAAVNVNAAEIYADDTNTIGLKVAADSFWSDLDNHDGSEADANFDLDAKIQLDVAHKYSGDKEVFASFEIENGAGFDWLGAATNSVENDDDRTAQFDDLVFGTQLTENITLVLGEVGEKFDAQNATTVDASNEGAALLDDYFYHRTESGADGAAIQFKTKLLEVVVDHHGDASGQNIESTGISAALNLGPITAGVSHLDQDVDGAETAQTAVAVKGTFGKLYLGANYMMQDGDGTATGNNEEITGFGISSRFGLTDNLSFYGNVGSAEWDQADEDLTYYSVGSDYAMSGNWTVFAEYGSQEFNSYAGESDTMIVIGSYFSL
ncbi:porin [Vibrio sp.]|nr:porin [Vibrio sp.]